MPSLRDVGQRLKLAREAQGLTLESISVRTRITVRHLLAIEEGNETDLPEVFYVRGFLKKYAEAVGLAPAEVADAYRTAPVPVTRPLNSGIAIGPILYYAIIVAVIGGAMAMAWQFQPKLSVVTDLSPSPASTPVPSATPTVVAVVTSPSPGSPGPSPGATTAPSPGASGAAPSASPTAVAAKPPSPSPTPVAAASADVSPAATATPAVVAGGSPAPSPDPSAVGASTAPEGSPTPKPSPTSLALTLVLQERSWVEVAVDGRPVFEGLLAPGVKKEFHGKRVEVTAGNAGGVRIFANGQDRGILGAHGVVVTKAFKP